MNAVLIERILDHGTELVVHWGPQVLVAILIFVAFWVVANVSDHAIERLIGFTHLNILVVALLKRAARFGLIFLGLVTALGTLGVNISALVAGLGLTGFALGFALKDAISNVLAGVLLLIYRPFGINDRINVNVGGVNHDGLVVAIDLRYTTLQSDAARILIPNSILLTNPIVVAKRPLGSS